jgi:hypothetical protein
MVTHGTNAVPMTCMNSHDAGSGRLYVRYRHLAGAQRRRHVPCPLLAERHFQVLPGGHRADRIAHAPDEVSHDEAPEPPLLAQDAGKHDPVLPRPLPVDRVVRAHHRVCPGVDDGPEVRQVYLMQRLVVNGHVEG